MSPDDLSREVVDSLLGREELIVRFLSLDRRSEICWRSSKGKEGCPPPRAGARHQPDGPPLTSLSHIHTLDHHHCRVRGDDDDDDEVELGAAAATCDVKWSLMVWQPGGQSDASLGGSAKFG